MQKLSEFTDTRLVELCLKNNSAAWEELVRRHRRRVFNIAYQFVARYDIAEDLTQELFIKIYGALDRFDRERHFVSWLTRITRNLCIDNYRRRQRERELHSSQDIDIATIESPRRDPYHYVRAQEKAEFLRRGLAELSSDLRKAVVLRDLQGYTYDEIATTLGIPEGTVKSRINRGRHELSRVLKDREKDENVMAPAGRKKKPKAKLAAKAKKKKASKPSKKRA